MKLYCFLEVDHIVDLSSVLCFYKKKQQHSFAHMAYGLIVVFWEGQSLGDFRVFTETRKFKALGQRVQPWP